MEMLLKSENKISVKLHLKALHHRFIYDALHRGALT